MELFKYFVWQIGQSLAAAFMLPPTATENRVRIELWSRYLSSMQPIHLRLRDLDSPSNSHSTEFRLIKLFVAQAIRFI